MTNDLAVAVDVLACRVATLTAQLGAALADAHASRESLAVVAGERDALRAELGDARREIANLHGKTQRAVSWGDVVEAMTSAGVTGITHGEGGGWTVTIGAKNSYAATLSDAVRAAQP